MNHIYKECAIGARSPENEADADERGFLEELNANPGLVSRSGIRTLQGKPYFELLRRGEMMEASCLRCHGTPDHAPSLLVDIYGPQRSFHRKVGQVVSAISIRVPLSAAYAEANFFSLRLSGLLLILLLAFLLTERRLNQRLLLAPLDLIRDKANQIASDEKQLGKEIPAPLGREFCELVRAFNTMSVRLRSEIDNLEERIRDRTAQLERANEELKRDIARRQEIEESLQQSEARYRAVVEQSPDGIFLEDVDTRSLIEANPAFQHLLGYTPEEIQGLSIYDIVEADREDMDRKFQRMLRGIAPFTHERQYRRKDGSLVDVWLSSKGISYGEKEAACTLVRDITERRQAEAEREKLIADLQQALAHVKTLSGLLPICSGCKKIRNDQGYWSQVDTYIEAHSEATFTHGLCPECITKYYPELTGKIPKNTAEKTDE